MCLHANRYRFIYFYTLHIYLSQMARYLFTYSPACALYNSTYQSISNSARRQGTHFTTVSRQQEIISPTVHDDRKTCPTVHADRKTRLTVHADRKTRLTVHADRKTRLTVHADRKSRLTVHADRKTRLTVHSDRKTCSTVHTDRKTCPTVHADRKTCPTVHAAIGKHLLHCTMTGKNACPFTRHSPCPFWHG